MALAVRVEAELAERTGADDEEVSRAAERADAFIARLRRLSPATAEPRSLPSLDAHMAQAEAERARIHGTARGDAWRAVAEQWAALGQLPACAYARLMEARTRVGYDTDRARTRAAITAADSLGATILRDQVNTVAAHFANVEVCAISPRPA